MPAARLLEWKRVRKDFLSHPFPWKEQESKSASHGPKAAQTASYAWDSGVSRQALQTPPLQPEQPAQPPGAQQEELCAARMAKWMQTPKTKRTIQSAKDMGKPAPFRQDFEERDRRETCTRQGSVCPLCRGGRKVNEKERTLIRAPAGVRPDRQKGRPARRLPFAVPSVKRRLSSLPSPV